MKKLSTLLAIFFMFFALNIKSQILTTVDQIIYDHIIYDHMGPAYRPNTSYTQWSHWGAHEDHLKISTDWEWYDGARPKDWMEHGTNQAISAWGQIIESESNSPITNVRFQIRNHRMYIFTNNQWILGEDISSNIEAERFDNTTFNWTGKVIESRDETNNGGGVSYPAQPDYIIHWWRKTWPIQRCALPTSFEAIYVTCEIRLIPNTDPNVNLENVRYLAGVSADYYPTINTNGVTVPGLSEPRHKIITSQWKTFTAYITGETPPTTEIEYREQILNRQLPPNTILTTEINEQQSKKIMNVYFNTEFTQITVELSQLDKNSILKI